MCGSLEFKKAQDPKNRILGFFSGMKGVLMSVDRKMYGFGREFPGKNSLGETPFEREVLFACRWVRESGSDSFFVFGDSQVMQNILDYLGGEDVRSIGSENHTGLITSGVRKFLKEKNLDGVDIEVESMGNGTCDYQVRLSRSKHETKS